MQVRPARFSVLALLLLTGCSGGGGVGAPARTGSTATAQVVGGVQTLDVVGSAADVFDQTTLYAEPGRLRIRFRVVGGTPHDLQVEGIAGADTALISGGGQTEITFNVTAGTYRFVCTIHPGSMHGTLVVRAAPGRGPFATPSAG